MKQSGGRLLSEAWQRLQLAGARALRVVSAQKDLPKKALLGSAGLSVVEEWWVKPLKSCGHSDNLGTVQGSRFSGHLGAAFRSTTPGGPVLPVGHMDPGAALVEMER